MTADTFSTGARSDDPERPNTLEALKSFLRDQVEECAGIAADLIRDDSAIDTDLAMESISFVYLQVAIEDTLGIECDPLELVELNRFDAIAESLFQRMG